MTGLDLSAAHARLLTVGPLIQNITNTVVQQFSANVLLAVGAAPAMIDHEADAGQFAALADGIVVNLGTASSHQFLAADAAIQTATATATPWVLDPVSVGVTDYRTGRIHQAVRQNPTVIRGNASEIAVLAGMGAGGRGVDSTDAVDAVLPAAVQLSMTTGAIVAVSGAVDAIVDNSEDMVRVARIAGGHELMPRVIGTGCSLGSVTAAYVAACRASDLAQTESDFAAVVAAHAHFAVAGGAAGTRARGPGSFAPAFIDALYHINRNELQQAVVSIDHGPRRSFLPTNMTQP